MHAGFYLMTPDASELQGMRAALREGRVPVRFFAEQDFLNGYFKAGPSSLKLPLSVGVTVACWQIAGCKLVWSRLLAERLPLSHEVFLISCRTHCRRSVGRPLPAPPPAPPAGPLAAPALELQRPKAHQVAPP